MLSFVSLIPEFWMNFSNSRKGVFWASLARGRSGTRCRSVQFSHTLCLTLCDPMDYSTPGLPVYHQLPELAQTYVHQVSDAIQSSHPLSSPSSPAFNLSQHQGFFQGVSSSHHVAKVMAFQLQHPSFQWIFKTGFLRLDWFDLLAVQGTQESSNTIVQKDQFFGAQPSL